MPAHLLLNSFGFKSPNSHFTGIFKCLLILCFNPYPVCERSKYAFHFFLSLVGLATHITALCPHTNPSMSTLRVYSYL